MLINFKPNATLMQQIQCCTAAFTAQNECGVLQYAYVASQASDVLNYQAPTEVGTAMVMVIH